MQALAGEESKDSDYLFDDVHSVTTGSAFVRLYSRIVFCTLFFPLVFRKFLSSQEESSCKVSSESFDEGQHDSVFYSLEDQHDSIFYSLEETLRCWERVTGRGRYTTGQALHSQGSNVENVF